MSLYALPGSVFPPILTPSTSEASTPTTRNESREQPCDSSCTNAHDCTATHITVKDAILDPCRFVQSLSRRAREPHNDAIEFELSISFNGRKYTVKRSMRSIMQLRSDLVDEMTGNSSSRHSRSRHSHNSYHHKQQQQKQERMKRQQNFENTNHQQQHPQKSHSIPEIPNISDDEHHGVGINSGFVGRGFSMLHSMMQQYRVDMEQWLWSVMSVVPHDSQSLANFLWEPLGANPTASPVSADSSDSLTTLGSIQEGDDDEEEE